MTELSQEAERTTEAVYSAQLDLEAKVAARRGAEDRERAESEALTVARADLGRYQDAVDAARLTALPDLVRLEPGFDPAVLRGLEDAGVPTAVAAGHDPYFGGVSALSARGAGSDPRRSGHTWVRQDAP
jgi:gamma-glutamyltranspeptidase/glutathione hydrolase